MDEDAQVRYYDSLKANESKGKRGLGFSSSEAPAKDDSDIRRSPKRRKHDKSRSRSRSSDRRSRRDEDRRRKEERRSRSRSSDRRSRRDEDRRRKEERRRSPSRERKRSSSRERRTRRSSSRERKRRSLSKDRKRSTSRERKRSPSRERKRSPSRERKRSRSRERKRSPSRERRRSHSRERKRRSSSRERRRSSSRERRTRRRSPSVERRRSVSRERKRRRSSSRERGRRSVSSERRRGDNSRERGRTSGRHGQKDKGSDDGESEKEKKKEDTNHTKPKKIDWEEAIAGYASMSEPERVKAKMRYNLAQIAAKKGLNATTGEEEGGGGGGGGDERSGWERYEFNQDANMEGDDLHAQQKADIGEGNGQSWEEAEEERLMRMRTLDFEKDKGASSPSLTAADRAHADAMFAPLPKKSKPALSDGEGEDGEKEDAPSAANHSSSRLERLKRHQSETGSTKKKEPEEEGKGDFMDDILSSKVKSQQRHRQETWTERVQRMREQKAKEALSHPPPAAVPVVQEDNDSDSGSDIYGEEKEHKEKGFMMRSTGLGFGTK